MSRADQRIAGWLVGTVACLVLGFVLGSAWTMLRYPKRAFKPGDDTEVEMVVTRGMGPIRIARALAEKGVIEHPMWFRIYATERGDARRLRAGSYTVTPGMSPEEILDALVAGAPDKQVSVTLPEGKNILEVAALISEAGICRQNAFIRAARDRQLMQKLGVPGESFEGYLYPDSYKFRPLTKPEKVIERLVRRGKKVYAELAAEHAKDLKQLKKQYGFDDHQVILMASLVEKETAAAEERPRIAGVFLNRLRLPTFRPHLLQTDPTIAYGCTVPPDRSPACKQFKDRIRRIHLVDTENRYNTYTHEGLPPGPIASPGRKAIEAVMKPDDTPYLYFVSKNDGTHYFSKTREEHERAVDKYQR